MPHFSVGMGSVSALIDFINSMITASSHNHGGSKRNSVFISVTNSHSYDKGPSLDSNSDLYGMNSGLNAILSAQSWGSAAVVPSQSAIRLSRV